MAGLARVLGMIGRMAKRKVGTETAENLAGKLRPLGKEGTSDLVRSGVVRAKAASDLDEVLNPGRDLSEAGDELWEQLFSAEKASLDKLEQMHGRGGVAQAVMKLNDIMSSTQNLREAAPEFRRWLRTQLKKGPAKSGRRSTDKPAATDLSSTLKIAE